MEEYCHGFSDWQAVVILELKKWEGPLRGQGKSRGGQQSYLLYMYRTYVNQMNLNGKLRKKLGGPSKNLGGHGSPGPPLESPLLASC